MLINFCITRQNIASGVATFTLSESYKIVRATLKSVYINVDETALSTTAPSPLYCKIGGGIEEIKPFTRTSSTNNSKTILLGQGGANIYTKHDAVIVDSPCDFGASAITFTIQELSCVGVGAPLVYTTTLPAVSDTIFEGADDRMINIAIDIELTEGNTTAIN